VQAPQLQHDEEQEEDDRADRVQQVLPLLPEAYGAQGNEVGGSKGEVRSKWEVVGVALRTYFALRTSSFKVEK
jgi:hypothetical protein